MGKLQIGQTFGSVEFPVQIKRFTLKMVCFIYVNDKTKVEWKKTPKMFIKDFPTRIA